MTLARIQAALSAIEAWAVANDITMGLLPGAREADIAAAEAEMGLAFPPDYRALLLAHDGQDESATMPWFLGREKLQPLAAILEQWRSELEYAADAVDGVDASGLFHFALNHPKRVPIAGTNYFDGDNTYLDFHPGPQGQPGQVLGLVSECDFEVFGPDVLTMLEAHAQRLAADELTWDADAETLAEA